MGGTTAVPSTDRSIVDDRASLVRAFEVRLCGGLTSQSNSYFLLHYVFIFSLVPRNSKPVNIFNICHLIFTVLLEEKHISPGNVCTILVHFVTSGWGSNDPKVSHTHRTAAVRFHVKTVPMGFGDSSKLLAEGTRRCQTTTRKETITEVLID